ncbi:MAG: hypothetical protein LBB73_08485 [Dysgonamonadaceae bacterium]|jgi:hypothetical protein|nr:hypothetical protein [Dysgonamonadaceae bacterium]
MKHSIKPRRTGYFLIITLLIAASCSESFDKKVKDSVNNQLSVYPQSNLQDIYKNFFQDRFGPGHLIPDTATAGEYLREELGSYTEDNQNPLLELIGWEGNYYRVNLDVLKLNIIPADVYLEAFVESANSVPAVSPDKWKNEWKKITGVIEKMNLALPDYESDKAKIQDLIEKGDFVVHHSPVFENTYHPHYRIIKKDIVLKKIKPQLP